MTTKQKFSFAARAMQSRFETASVDEYTADPSVDYSSQIAELSRANALLDRNKNSLFLDILSNLSTKTACEKAAASYDTDFWLSIPLSWGSVIELMKEASLLLKRFKTNVPSSWSNLADTDLSNLDTPDNQESDEAILNSVERRVTNSV